MKTMKRMPTHPGCVLREDYLKPLSLSVSELALKLGISRKTLSRIVNEKGSVTPDIALRLAMALGTTPDLWLNLQKGYDLWKAANASDDWRRVTPFVKKVIHP